MYYVYLLECSDNSTYVGATVNLEHRLRQHNKEIKGGAVATSRKVVKGHIWKRRCHVAGFPTWSAALQFEWAWKFQSRKLSPKLLPMDRRKEALNNLLKLDRPTSKALMYSEWDEPIQVIWEHDV
jgi:structure-specific endonuclease subunit SLX1